MSEGTVALNPVMYAVYAIAAVALAVIESALPYEITSILPAPAELS